ncbi:MAG: hypothetical protein ACRCUY_08715 [Thermoguttaceae bacterium]
MTLLGCSSNLPEGLPRLYPCTIAVIQDGSPLIDATVVLQSNEPGHIWIPMGTTDATGTATIYTNGRYLGAELGSYKILVSKGISESSAGPPPPEDSPEYPKWTRKASNAEIREYAIVDPLFSDPSKTPHVIEITKKKNAATVDVGKTVKIRQM